MRARSATRSIVPIRARRTARPRITSTCATRRDWSDASRWDDRFDGLGSRIDPLEKPDRLVFDLDPDEGVDFADTKKAAEHLKNQLAELGLVSFPLLSGQGRPCRLLPPMPNGPRSAISPTASPARSPRPSPTALPRR
ncbi:hypothetical protein AB5I41_06060 [Sphingomonas sp. MMS24-JH45]